MSYYPNEALALKRLARADALAYIARIQETQPPREQLAMLRMKALHMVRPMPETWGSSFYEPVVEEDILLLHSKDRESDIRRHLDYGSDVHLAGEVYEWFDSYVGTIAKYNFDKFEVYDNQDDGYYFYFEAYPIFLLLTSEESRSLLQGLSEFVLTSGHLKSVTDADFMSAFRVLSDSSSDASSVIRTLRDLPFRFTLGFSRAIVFALAQQTLLPLEVHPELKPSAIDEATKDVSIYDVFAVAKQVLPPLPFSQFVHAFDFGLQYGTAFRDTLEAYADDYLSSGRIGSIPIPNGKVQRLVTPTELSKIWPTQSISQDRMIDEASSKTGSDLNRPLKPDAVISKMYGFLRNAKVLASNRPEFVNALKRGMGGGKIEFETTVPLHKIALIIREMMEILDTNEPNFSIWGYHKGGSGLQSGGKIKRKLDYDEDLRRQLARPDSKRDFTGKYETLFDQLRKLKSEVMQDRSHEDDH